MMSCGEHNQHFPFFSESGASLVRHVRFLMVRAQELVHAWADWVVTARSEHKCTTFSGISLIKPASFNLTDSFSASLRFQRKK